MQHQEHRPPTPHLDDLADASLPERPGFARVVAKVQLKQVRDGHVGFSVERINGPREIYDAVRPFYHQADREMLSVVCLDANNQPTCFNIVSVGGLNTTRTKPVDILKPAILSNSLGIVLVHNHPSGNPEPSPEDVEFTRAMAQACECVGVELYDHVIVTDSGFTSLRERGVM